MKVPSVPAVRTANKFVETMSEVDQKTIDRGAKTLKIFFEELQKVGIDLKKLGPIKLLPEIIRQVGMREITIPQGVSLIKKINIFNGGNLAEDAHTHKYSYHVRDGMELCSCGKVRP